MKPFDFLSVKCESMQIQEGYGLNVLGMIFLVEQLLPPFGNLVHFNSWQP